MYTRYSKDDQVGIIRQDSIRDVYYFEFFNHPELNFTVTHEYLYRMKAPYVWGGETIDGEVITNVSAGPKELT